MSKFREALEEAYKTGRSNMLSEIASAGGDLVNQGKKIDEIAQHYGDLEFTREEVRAKAHRVATSAAYEATVLPGKKTPLQIADEMVSLHLGEATEAKDDETDLLHAVAKRLLADGHAENCETRDIRIPAFAECTCGHDELREAMK